MDSLFNLCVFAGGFCGLLFVGFAIQLTYIRITKGSAAAKKFFNEEFFEWEN